VAAKKSPTPSFESALAELETLVEHMEAGELSLDDALKSFERGIALTRSCQISLKEAEQKVQILSGNSVDSALEDFDHES